MDELKKIKVVCLFTALLSLVLIALGGYVRATGAGLACPDWPLCFGRVVPEFSQGVAQEYIHRVIAGLVALCSLVLLAMTFRLRAKFTRLWRVGIFLFVLVIIQAVFGGLTVIMQLNPFIVTAHLALGTLFFLVVALLAIERNSERFSEKRRVNSSIEAESSFAKSLILFVTAAVYFQMILGGFVGSSGAALVCSGFPLCNGQYIPDNVTGAQVVQIAHRLLGVVVLVLLVVALLMSKRSKGLVSKRFGHLCGMLTLVLIQISLGIANVLMQIPIGVAIMHLVVAQLLLFGLASLYKELNPAMRIIQIKSSGVAAEVRSSVEMRPLKEAFNG